MNRFAIPKLMLDVSFQMRVLLFLFLSVVAWPVFGAEKTISDPRGLPGSDLTLDALASSTTAVIACTAKGEAEIVKRLDGWETSVTRGCVHVACAYCRQKFQDMELLHGKASLEDRVLEYGYVEEDTFPVPRNEKAIPPNAKVILWLGKDGGIVKALPNTKENREAVRLALSQAEEKAKKAAQPGTPHAEP